MLALGYGGKTSIISRPPSGCEGEWKILDTIPEPCEGPHGTVTVLGFVGDSLTNHRLIVGHAKAGFCTWTAPGEYHSTPYDAQGLVCSIGSAAFSTDGRFLAIATLDHSLVIYPMSQKGGPVVHQRQVLPTHEQAAHRPIIPIALAANNLVLKGSTTGKVPIIDLQSGPLAPIEHGSQEMVRSLAAYGDKVVVGLSDSTSQDSQIKCYLDRTSSLANYARLQKNSDDPLFEVGIPELEKRNNLLTRIAHSKLAKSVCRLHAKWLKKAVQWLELMYRRDTWIILGVAWMFLVILVVDPPSIPGPKLFEIIADRQSKTTSTQVSTHRAYGYQGSDNATPSNNTQYPNLFSLVMFCVMYVAWRFFLWGGFVVSLAFLLVGIAVGSLIRFVALLPHGIHFFMTDIPSLLSAIICDAVPAIAICPKPM
ncbi:hypothetical protein FS749_015489 [Ceratobasidium sp. UAMH 11750]|nr:hypothetical protein FS749_015489 [Ceratobasidium sp. UAMH 11750]